MADRAHVMAKRSTAGHLPRAGPSLRRLAAHFQNAQAMARIAAGPTILQPALKVGAANDPLEREAETMAERVVSMPAPQMAAPDAAGEGVGGMGDAMRASADDQPNTDALEADPPIPEDHLDPEVPPVEDVDTEALSAADMNEIETGAPADTGGDPPLPETPAPAGEGALPGSEETAMPARGDGAAVGAEGGPAPPDVARHVVEPGAGRPLPDAVRAFMEPRFGRDFSAVRVHDSSERPPRRAPHRRARLHSPRACLDRSGRKRVRPQADGARADPCRATDRAGTGEGSGARGRDGRAAAAARLYPEQGGEICAQHSGLPADLPDHRPEPDYRGHGRAQRRQRAGCHDVASSRWQSPVRAVGGIAGHRGSVRMGVDEAASAQHHMDPDQGPDQRPDRLSARLADPTSSTTRSSCSSRWSTTSSPSSKTWWARSSNSSCAAR